jgi:hypothetical protein
MRKAQFAAVLSLAFFALLGACLILSQDGFATSSKRGDWSIFVPAPQAYVMAGIMFTLSVLGLLWLLQQLRASRSICLLSIAGYGIAAFGLTKALATYLR